MVKIFVQENIWTFKPLKHFFLDTGYEGNKTKVNSVSVLPIFLNCGHSRLIFYTKKSKNKHFNSKNIHPTKLLGFQNNFTKTLVIN